MIDYLSILMTFPAFMLMLTVGEYFGLFSTPIGQFVFKMAVIIGFFVWVFVLILVTAEWTKNP